MGRSTVEFPSKKPPRSDELPTTNIEEWEESSMSVIPQDPHPPPSELPTTNIEEWEGSSMTAIQDTPPPHPPLPSSHSSLPSSKPPIFIPAPSLASSRYHRQLLIPSISLRGQTLLSNTKVLIVGLGGLGCPAALYLAGAGVHTLGLVDGDTVEQSNLHRQVLHREDSVGRAKVDSAARGLTQLNSQVRCRPYGERLSAHNALEIVSAYDVVLDCTDNPATRYLLSDACVLLGKPLVSGAAQRTEGQLMLLNYPVGQGPCYRCVFPRPPAPEMVLGCSEIGVLGPVVGVIGVLMAGEAIRLIVAQDEEEREAFKPSLLLYNAFSRESRGRFRAVGLRGRRIGCAACGADDDMSSGEERITMERFREGRVDYEAFCGRLQEVKILGKGERVSAREFLKLLGGGEEGRAPIVVDVREENEVELGPKISGSLNIPFSRILRHGVGVGEDVFHAITNARENGDEKRPVYFLCQRGNDSQIAARKMMDAQLLKGGGDGRMWIGDVEGGFVAIEREAEASL
jgi:adenylyltransferase and sulfurtransferase